GQRVIGTPDATLRGPVAGGVSSRPEPFGERFYRPLKGCCGLLPWPGAATCSPARPGGGPPAPARVRLGRRPAPRGGRVVARLRGSRRRERGGRRRRIGWRVL